MLGDVKRVVWPYWSRALRAWNTMRIRVQGGFHNGRRIVPYHSGEGGNRLIKGLIEGDDPVMIARYGDIELMAIWSVLTGSSPEEQLRRARQLRINAGVFPVDLAILSRFTAAYEDAARRLDCLAIWNFERGRWKMEERIFREFSPDAALVSIRSIESWLFRDPWTEALRGQRVLVVHPFDETIRKQYVKRNRLFEDERVLPDFESLETLRAVQSAAGSATPFATWFHALDAMCSDIANREFDVALIGAGGYGLPLAAFVKGLGKKAVHMGGVTQILFGIMGARWEKVIPGGYPPLTRFANASWTRPLSSERPEGFESVDGGAYW